MPRIAEVVNRFSSEENQCVALGALVRALGSGLIRLYVRRQPNRACRSGRHRLMIRQRSMTTGSRSGCPVGASAAARRRSRKSATKKSWSRAKDINFRPEGKPSLRDFAAEKDPASNHEKNVVAVYYLEEVLMSRAAL
jgi:hypothetical protein